MKKTTLRRFWAYVIDIMIVTFISSMFSYIPILNPKLDEYESKYNEYMEEYTSLLETMDTETLNLDHLSDLTYEFTKAGIYISLITVVITALYFTGFQYINKGQTIGKKLVKIKVVSTKDKLTFKQVLIRTLICDSILTSTITLILLGFASKSVYLNVSQYVSMLDMCLIFGCIIFALFREDGRGLHDLIASTRVVFDTQEETEPIKEAKVVEEVEAEKVKVVKKKSTAKKKVNKDE